MAAHREEKRRSSEVCILLADRIPQVAYSLRGERERETETFPKELKSNPAKGEKGEKVELDYLFGDPGEREEEDG